MTKEHLAVLQKSLQQRKEIKAFLRRIKKGKHLDTLFHEAHNAVFKTTDCLQCAQCCKTTSPIFRDADIRRIAKHLKVKEATFIADYLRIDEDSDMVLTTSPCPFLGPDNACSIYQHRPLACREYPHTNRKNMHQILHVTERNTQVCPAVAKIVFKLME
ncbi:MAG: YkgJ family cysteine cluster protein [Flavobacteriales bacterium]